MAGSLRWFRYLDDGGTPYAVFLDESNTELANLSADTTATIPTLQLPKNVEPRYIRYKEAGGKISRKVTILSIARFAAINGTTAILLGDGDIDSGFTLTVSSKSGEKVTRIPRTADSGKDDGDNP
jgi:hypothetical protein